MKEDQIGTSRTGCHSWLPVLLPRASASNIPHQLERDVVFPQDHRQPIRQPPTDDEVPRKSQPRCGSDEQANPSPVTQR